MNRRLPSVTGIALSIALVALGSAARAETNDEPGFEERSRAFEQRIAALDAVDPLQPDALDARIEYARLLHATAIEDCLPYFDEAERQLAPVLSADPNALIAWPDGPSDALSLLQTIQNARGQCADDAGVARTAFEASIATGERAIAMLRDNWDFEEMAISMFNVAFARRELGDLDGALRDLEQVLAWDQEFGFRDELGGDYAALLRWRADGAEPDPDQVERFVNSVNQRKARFTFRMSPHQSHGSTEIERTDHRKGAFAQVTTRYRSLVNVRQEKGDWLLTTSLDGAPEVTIVGGTQPADANQRMQGMIAGLAGALPQMVIAADGTFKELRNLEQHRSRMMAEIRKLVQESTPAGQPAELEATMMRVLDATLSPELLTTLAAGGWDIAVGAWIDGEFDHGDWYSLTFEAPLPGFSERPVKKTMTFKVSRWLPCATGGAPNCAEILVRIIPDVDDMTRAVKEFVARIMPAASLAEIEAALNAVRYQFDLRYRLVTEPDTLRLWAFEERKYIYASSIEDGKRVATARRDRRRESARYQD